MKNNKIEFGVILFLFIVTSVLVFFGLMYQWFGVPDDGILKFCERGREGLIKQPANTYSNLAFSFIAIYIAWFSSKTQFELKNAMTTKSIYLIIFALSLIITGAGSFAMHATFAHWGGFADLFGMFMISSFVFTYALKRLLKLSDLAFLISFTIAVSMGSYVFLSPSLNFEGLIGGASSFFALQLILGIAIELYLKYFRNNQINSKYGYNAIGLILISFVIWNMSVHRDSILCNPDSLLQGHAVWHILDAIATLYIYKYYISENAPLALT